MRVRVLFFGRLREIVGRAEEEIELPEGARVEDAFARCGSRWPALTKLRGGLVASVNQEYAAWTAALGAGDEVAFIPPVSGGDVVAAGRELVELVRETIRTAEVVAAMKAPADGATVVFEGIVRNESSGRATLYLEYEAYEAMALKKMQVLAGEARDKFAIDRIAIVHRLGRLEISETSVLIVVTAAHRGAAFDACRWAIDALKRTVPIWKKEFFADGAVWVEGELPPVEASPGSAHAGAPLRKTKPFPPPGESTF